MGLGSIGIRNPDYAVRQIFPVCCREEEVVDEGNVIDPIITFPLTGSTTNDLNVAFGGVALPGSTVELFVDDTLVWTGTANDNGRWGGTIPDGVFEDGETYILSAKATSIDGTTTSALSNLVEITVDITATNYILTEAGEIVTTEDGNQIIWE